MIRSPRTKVEIRLLRACCLCGMLAVWVWHVTSKVGASAPPRLAAGHARHTGVHATWCALHLVTREYAEAIEDCDQAIAQNPSDADAYSNRSAAYLMLDDLDRATADLEVAIRLDPTDAKLYYNRGVIHTKSHEHLKAIVDYTEAIRLNPEHVPAYYNRGVALELVGEHDKAIADYRQALRLAPSLAKARDALLRLGAERQQ